MLESRSTPHERTPVLTRNKSIIEKILCPPAKKARRTGPVLQAPPPPSAKPEIKQYVLDTNVLLHDPAALFQFQEHDVYLPLVVLEELDRHKKGITDVARNARQVTRTLESLLQFGSMQGGFDLSLAESGRATGRLYFIASQSTLRNAIAGLDKDKADNQILSCVSMLIQQGLDTTLVTNDINLRVKALASEVPAQGYRSDRVFSDEDILPSGFSLLDENEWAARQGGLDEPFWREKGRYLAQVTEKLPINSFLVETTAKGSTRNWRVQSNSEAGSVLYTFSNKAPAEGAPLLEAQNVEQTLALNLLRDPEVDFVALLGIAGTGKTLLALAAGLEQVKSGLYQDILITRATVPLGEEIGFLPGTEADKMNPWLGGTLKDVFSALNLDPNDQLLSKIEVASMTFMRGRSFQSKYIIVDEAQNLTIKQMRALLTRAGSGSKVVLTGNLGQIDSPYLDVGSSGLAWAVKNLQNWQHSGHIILPKSVRSRLASYVEDVAGRTE